MKAAALLLLATTVPALSLWFGPRSRSRWRDRTIVVDGKEDEWRGVEPDEQQGLRFAFVNDALDLFVMVSPHTRFLREQMAGIFEQDLTLWFDSKAGMNKKFGLRLKAPPGGSSDAGREFELVHEGDRSPPACESADLRLGAVGEHGLLEARVPFACFGAENDKIFTVGIEASIPKQPPPKRAGERFDRLYTWVRVTPAPPPK